MANKKIKILNHNDELVKYMASEYYYEPQMNILLNDPKNDWYKAIGKRMWQQFEGNLPLSLKGFGEVIKDSSWKGRLKRLNGKIYTRMAIYFLTSTLGPDLLKDLFGEPLLHSEFGEGFNHDGHQGEQYASYFVEILDIKTHIGYDHRGTSIEFGKYKDRMGMEITPLATMVAFCIAELVEEVKKVS